MRNWYNLPTYYDVSFSHEMGEELAFLKAIFNQHCKAAQAKLLEPACGTGRLLIPLVRAGFDCSGFDLNENALDYLRKKLERNRLRANIFNANMADFQIKPNKYDAAFCTVDTFRHLLSEKMAEQHLFNISKSLKKNGIYVLGLHLIPESGATNKVTRWTNKRGRLTIHTTMTMLEMDKNKRTETLKVVLKPKTKNKKESHTSIYKLRTYTLKQFLKLINKTSMFEIVNVYDEYYLPEQPVVLNFNTEYAVLVLRKRPVDETDYS